MVNRQFFIVVASSLGFLLFGCHQNSFENEEALLNYMKDESHGYIQKKSVNGIDFQLTYRPTDLLVSQELGDSVTNERVQTLRKKYSKYLYFNLSMSKNNQELLSAVPKDRNEFGAMVSQLAFGMGEKIHLYTEARDTVELEDFIYPRMYGMSQSTIIMFVYPRKEKTLVGESLNFTIEDIGLFTGEVKFKIPTDIINNQPSLVF